MSHPNWNRSLGAITTRPEGAIFPKDVEVVWQADRVSIRLGVKGANDQLATFSGADAGRRLPDLFDLLGLVLFTVLSLWTVFFLLSQQGSDHLWTGTNGAYIGDQMQYVGWIRSSYQHILVGNPFETSGGIRDYLNPAFVLSELLVGLGVSASVSYLVWTPVAAIALGLATWAYINRTLSNTTSRRIALVLALFYLSPLPLIAMHLHWSAPYLSAYAFEMWPAFYLWGYPLTALSVALLMGCLLTLARARDERKFSWTSPTCALFCAWLQPWQGATLVLIVVGCEIYVRRRRLSRTKPSLLAATLAAAIAPLLYYFLLSHFDGTWALSGQVNNHTEPVWDLIFTLLPLGIFAVIAYVRRPHGFASMTAYIWPIASLVVFLVIDVIHGTSPDHALQGLNVPVSILAVVGLGVLSKGLTSRTWMVVTAILVATLVIIPVAYELNVARGLGQPAVFGAEPYFIRTSEARALEYLARSPQEGAVLSTLYLGQIVPAETGRNTWVGIASWTPEFSDRVGAAERLFSKQMTQNQAIALVRGSGVRFLVSDCDHREDLSSTLKPILRSTIRFGCATVYILNPQSRRAR
jgi:hypothetical protein